VYGGDDGITPNISKEALVSSAVAHGHDLTSEVANLGSSVKFLARIYSPYVWQGCNNSMCDVPRQLAKFHVTHNLPANVTPLQKLHEKSMGMYMSDRNTPIFGPLSKAVVDLMGVVDFKYDIASYFSRYPDNEQYPNVDSGWMEAELRLRLPTIDLDRFNTFIGKVSEAEQLLSLPLIVEDDVKIEAKKDVVVNGDIVRKVKKQVKPAGDSKPRAENPVREHKDRKRREPKSRAKPDRQAKPAKQPAKVLAKAPIERKSKDQIPPTWRKKERGA